jgi:hypothetical protein
MKKTTQANLIENTASMPWTELAPGVEVKRVVPDGAFDDFTTAIYRLAPQGVLPELPSGYGLELMVLEGELSFEHETLGVGGYARRPASSMELPRTTSGCTLYVKAGLFDAGETGHTTLKVGDLPWRPGHGQLEVKPLHEFAGKGCALVRWPAGERFIPHRHWGGEEVFVLSGTFEDEHGSYPSGTWIQSAHLSEHHPFVRDETVIFVRTGHLPIPQ